MHRAVVVAMVSLLGGLLGAPARATPPAKPLSEIPSEWKAAVDRAFVAFQQLQERLQRRLLDELASQGPAGAVGVCREVAPALTESVARETNLLLGRTSHRLRNPVNRARTWAQEYVDANAGRPASEVQPVWFDLGGRIGVLRPIATGGLCLLCHGQPDGMDPQLRAVLAELYPNDRAVGFREGELRGFFWAEVEKPKAPQASHDAEADEKNAARP